MAQSVLRRQGRLDEARTHGEQACRLVPSHTGLTGSLAAILHLQGDADGAAALLAAVEAENPAGVPVMRFDYHAGVEQFAEAARWLDKCIELRDTRAPWILPNLWGPAFTASPYWPPLARKMNLPA